jgi:hypothetical protein
MLVREHSLSNNTQVDARVTMVVVGDPHRATLAAGGRLKAAAPCYRRIIWKRMRPFCRVVSRATVKCEANAWRKACSVMWV